MAINPPHKPLANEKNSAEKVDMSAQLAALKSYKDYDDSERISVKTHSIFAGFVKKRVSLALKGES